MIVARGRVERYYTSGIPGVLPRGITVPSPRVSSAPIKPHVACNVKAELINSSFKCECGHNRACVKSEENCDVDHFEL